jgi:Protein of unknown function (DUF1501)
MEPLRHLTGGHQPPGCSSSTGGLRPPLGPGRRDFLKVAGLAGLSWLTPVGHLLAHAAEKRQPAQSIILLWMQGGPSQLETFDPHPGTASAGGTRAVDTAVKGVQLAEGFGYLAEEMASVALLRSVTSKEGDHERGTYTMKTGFRPDPTVTHPAIGAILCHELPGGNAEIPRHIAILPDRWYPRGGFLGDEFDAFKTGDPIEKVPNVAARVPDGRDRQRLQDLEFLEGEFARGRGNLAEAAGNRTVMNSARLMMSSEQLKAFDVAQEPAKLRAGYGDTPFGRGCLAARRLIEVGVRCVEVTLGGWDTHADNHKFCKQQVAILDPAFAALLRDLRERRLLERTVVICAGEFGRTPKINGVGGRDHWPSGFSVALAGGSLHCGQVLGATDPEGKADPTDPVTVADIHATVMTAVGIDPKKVMTSPIGRTVTLSEGKVIGGLLG